MVSGRAQWGKGPPEQHAEEPASLARRVADQDRGPSPVSSEDEELVSVLPPQPPAAVQVQTEEAPSTPCAPTFKVDASDLPTPVPTAAAIAAWQQGDQADKMEP